MSMIAAILFCIAAQAITFIPFYRVWRQDLDEYGSDLGVPLRKRFAAWLVMFPVWALPFSVMIGRMI